MTGPDVGAPRRDDEPQIPWDRLAVQGAVLILSNMGDLDDVRRCGVRPRPTSPMRCLRNEGHDGPHHYFAGNG